MLRRLRTLIFLLAILILAAGGLPACSSNPQGELPMMSMDRMPSEVKSAPVVVQQAYQYAAANPEVMKAIPCYCGCGSIGHTSNYSCYVSGQNADGSLVFDNHALGCSICVDITRDAMRLTQQGKSPPEIKAYVDDAYGKYGTSNMQ
jgi:hypothetical protein